MSQKKCHKHKFLSFCFPVIITFNRSIYSLPYFFSKTILFLCFFKIYNHVIQIVFIFSCIWSWTCKPNLLIVIEVDYGGIWQPTPVLLPGGLRSMGSLGVRTTEWLHFHFSLSCIGEGNGNSLQYSFLENPRDGGAWWAAVYGVAQSWTRLKRLSSSSMEV